MAIIFNTISLDIIAFLVIFFGVIYGYVKYIYTYWDRRGVKYLQPKFPLGNFADFFLQKISIGELVQKMYSQTTEPFIGIYGAIRPTLLVRDPALIRRIFITDFQYFADRGVYLNEASDPLSSTLFAMEVVRPYFIYPENSQIREPRKMRCMEIVTLSRDMAVKQCFYLQGEKWKNLRAKLTPLFTSGKLKAMYSTLLECSVHLKQYLNKEAENGNVVDMREIAARYTTDIIGSTIFGIEVNTIKNPDTPFRNFGRKALGPSLMNGVRAFTRFVYPKLQKTLNIKTVDNDVEEFFINLVKDTMEYREKNNITRKDLLQLLIQVRNTGNVEDDDVWDTTITNDNKKKLTLNEMAAQAWVFYVAGFETSSSTMSFCLYELAKNMDLQRKVQKEIDEVTEKYNGEITYNSILEMKYLEMCMDETLRKYPISTMFNRIATRDYKIPDTNVIIEKGTPIIIPVLALHRDAKFYSDPQSFIPERFHPDNCKTFEEMPYCPFGDGPRGCIGIRMGKMQTKVGLVVMLQDYTYNLVNKDELKISPKSFLLQPTTGINLTITKRVK